MRNQSRRAEQAGVTALRPGRAGHPVLLACCLLSARRRRPNAPTATKPINLEADRMTRRRRQADRDLRGQSGADAGHAARSAATGWSCGRTPRASSTAAPTAISRSFRQKRDGYDEYIEGYAERIEYDGKADKRAVVQPRAPEENQLTKCAATTSPTTHAPSFSRVVGGGKQAATAGNPEGRVHAVIQPKSKDKPAAGPPLPLKPAADVANPRETPLALRVERCTHALPPAMRLQHACVADRAMRPRS